MCNLRDFESTKNLFEEYNPDYVIHLAANVGGLYKNLSQNARMFDDNVLINMNVVKCCKLVNVKKCICMLSTCIFPDKTEYPINEKMLHNGPPHYSNEGYAYAKRMLDVQTKLYNNSLDNKTHFVCVIPTNIYGPFDNFSLENGHVIPSLINRCYLSLLENKPFIIKGTGNALRQFIYSKDLAKILMIILEEYNDKEPVILAPTDKNNEYTIKDIVYTIANVFNQSLIRFDDSYSDGQYKKTASSNSLKKILEDYKNKTDIDFEFTSIQDGIKQTIEWFIKNYNNNIKK